MTTVYSLTRVEPVSRGGDPGHGLAATVQDPFWMLTRQRQFGELTGEDAGSPVQVAFMQKEARFDGWKPESGAVLPYSPQTDIVEALVAGEAAGPAHSTLDRVQAGRALAAAVSTSVGAKLRAAFPVHVAPDAPRMLVRAAAAVRRRARRRRRGRRRGRRDGRAARLRGEASDRRREGRARRPHRIRALVRDHLRHRAEQLDSRAPRAPLRARCRRQPGAGRARPHARKGRLVRLRRRRRNATPTNTGTATTRDPRSRRPSSSPASRATGSGSSRRRLSRLSRIDAATNDLARLALVEFSTIYGNDWFTFPDPRHVRIDAGHLGSRRARHLRNTRADRAGGGRAMGHVSADRITRRVAGAGRAVGDRRAARRRRHRGGSVPARRDGEPRLGHGADRHRR